MEIVKKHHPDRAGADNAESKAIFEVRNFAQGFDSGVMTNDIGTSSVCFGFWLNRRNAAQFVL